MSLSTKVLGVADLNKKLDQYRYLVDGRGLRWITTETAVKAKKILLDESKVDIGSDGKMSGWRRPPRKGVRVRAGFELRSDSTAEFIPKPNGVWKVLEVGRDPGISRVKRNRPARRYGRAPGKRTWSRAWDRITPNVPKWVGDANSELLRNSWR